MTALSIFALTLPACERQPSNAKQSSTENFVDNDKTTNVKLNNVDRWNQVRNLSPEGELLTPELNARIKTLASHDNITTRKILSGDDTLSAEVLDSLLAINQAYIAKLNELKPSALDMLRKRSVDNEMFTKVIDDDVEALLSDDAYKSALTLAFGKKDIDCKEVSTTLLLCALLRLEQVQLQAPRVQLKFVSGLCFDPAYVPNGIGHNWVEFDGNVLDWAIRNESQMTKLPADTALYVPIVWSEITYFPATQRAEVTTWTMPLP